MPKVKQTFIGRFTDKFMSYAWDILGLVLVVGMVAAIVKLLIGGL